MPRILIVDDQPEIVRGLEDNLRFEGYQTTSATNGEDALALALSDAPDLVLLDLMLPRMSGWDVCRELRRKGIDVPVIMLTARGAEVDRVLGLELGADDYVTKPSRCASSSLACARCCGARGRGRNSPSLRS